MPLNERNTRHPMRGLYSGQLKPVRMLVRNDHMNASIVRSETLYNCRWSRITKMGEQFDGDVAHTMGKMLHIFRSELDRVGVKHINALYVFVDDRGRFWQAEARDAIVVQLFENYVSVHCQRCDPIPTPGV